MNPKLEITSNKNYWRNTFGRVQGKSLFKPANIPDNYMTANKRIDIVQRYIT